MNVKQLETKNGSLKNSSKQLSPRTESCINNRINNIINSCILSTENPHTCNLAIISSLFTVLVVPVNL